MAEWLTQITAETSYQEALLTPSAINPYPQAQADGNFEVSTNWRMPTFLGNVFHHIRYADGKVYRGQFPLKPIASDFEIVEQTAETPADNRWQDYDPDKMQPFKGLWQDESPRLARRYLYTQSRQLAHESFARLKQADLEYRPSEFMQFELSEYRQHLVNGQPAAAYNVASRMFSDRIHIAGDVMGTNAVRMWIDYDLPAILEPALDQSNNDKWQNFMEIVGIGSTAAQCAVEVAGGYLESQALSMFAAQPNIPAAVAEKVVLLQTQVDGDRIKYANALAKTLQQLPEYLRSSNTPTYANYTAQQIGMYICEAIIGG